MLEVNEKCSRHKILAKKIEERKIVRAYKAQQIRASNLIFALLIEIYVNI